MKCWESNSLKHSMMNLDQARADSGGLTKLRKSTPLDRKNLELEEHKAVFQAEDEELKLKMPDGWAKSK